MFDTRFKSKKELKKYIKALEEQINMMCKTDISQSEIIIILKEENKKFKEYYLKNANKYEELIEKYSNLQEEIKRQEKSQVILDNQNAELQGRINKAINYINENYTNPDGFCWHSGFWPILEILKDEKIKREFEEEDNE